MIITRNKRKTGDLEYKYIYNKGPTVILSENILCGMLFEMIQNLRNKQSLKHIFTNKRLVNKTHI